MGRIYALAGYTLWRTLVPSAPPDFKLDKVARVEATHVSNTVSIRCTSP